MDSDAKIIHVKELRQRIKGVLGMLEQAGPSRECSLCRTKLQEAGMWLGMELRRLADGVSCYTEANDTSHARVDPAQPDAPIVDSTP